MVYNNTKCNPMQNIESDLVKMREFYLDTERQLIELSYVIPFYNDSKVYSPRLFNILQSACGQIESMLKLMCKSYDVMPEKDKPTFWDYYEKLNNNNTLARQKILFKSTRKVMTPFVISSGNAPDWWRKHNDTKHNLPDGILEGNMENTLQSMSGLYALHHICHYIGGPLNALQKYDNWNDEEITEERDPILFNEFSREHNRVFNSNIFYALTCYHGRMSANFYD